MSAPSLFRIFLAACCMLFSACGMFHEKEPKQSQVNQSASSDYDCELPKLKEMYHDETLQLKKAHQGLSCFRKKIDQVFSQVKGSDQDAVSAKEVYRLVHEHIIKADDFPLKNEVQFEGLAGVMSLLNPDGKPEVTKAQAKALANWLDDVLELYEKVGGKVESVNDLDRVTLERVFRKGLILFPGKGELNAPEIHDLATLIDDLGDRKRTENAFPIVKLIFRDSVNSAGDTRILGKSLRELIQLGVDGFEIFKNETFDKNTRNFVADHPAQCLAVAQLGEAYFRQKLFWALSASEVRAIGIDALNVSASLAENMILLARRFINEPDPDQAVSVRLFYPFFADAKSLIQDFTTLAQAYPKSAGGVRKRTDLMASEDPLLKSVAIKSNITQDYVSGQPQYLERKDVLISYSSALTTVTNRFIFRKLFIAFGDPKTTDPVKGIFIPKNPLSAAEERDAKDLAHLFLKFASTLSAPSNDKSDKTQTAQITVDDELNVKAESVYNIMGLVGDQWFTDGNHDGYLNSEEFFSVISLFIEATHLNSYTPKYYKTFTEDYWKSPVFTREDFITQILGTNGVSYLLKGTPYATLEKAIELMQKPGELFHSLMSRADGPIDAYQVLYDPSGVTHPQKVTLTDWVDPTSMVPANAMLNLLDRAFLKCDVDGDAKLNWQELDCAAELLAGGLYFVIDSGVINLDPGVRDGIILLSKQVYDPKIEAATSVFEKRLRGLPREVFKLYLSQGNPSAVIDPKLLETLSFTPSDLIATVILDPKPELMPIYLAEINRIYGACDVDHNGVYNGKELDCVFAAASTKWIGFLNSPDVHSAFQGLLPFLSADQINGVLGSDNFKAWFVYFAKGVLPVAKTATETSILDAFQQAIQRDCPLGKIYQDGVCLQQ